MFNPEKKIGASLLVLGMMISGRAMAQAETTPTCVKAPTCEELGYDKVASDCGELAKLRCPFDPDKYFCTAYTDQNGKKLAEIGDFVYVDAISAEPISGRIPVGIVYDLSGKMMSLAQFGHRESDKCASYTTDGTSGWSLASMEDMGLIKANVDKINAQLAKIPNTKKIETGIGTYYGNDRLWETSDTMGACMVAGVPITATGNAALNGCANNNNNEGTHALCVRSFGSGGAGSSPETSLAPGSDYKDDTGTIIGTVITSNGKKGIIVNRAVRSGTRDEAIAYCEQLKTGGLTWFLPSFEQMVKVCEVKAYGFQGVSITLNGHAYWISDSGYYIQIYPYGCSHTGNNKTDIQGRFEYFCAATY